MSSNCAEDCIEFTILYYKRKVSKVHKSKGVSKMDGTLTILPPPKASILLKNENTVVYRGSIAEIGKQAYSLQEDEIISIGNYEVEICDRIGVGKSSNTVTPKTSATDNTGGSLLSRSSKVPRRPLHPNSRPIHPARKKPNRIARGSTTIRQPFVSDRRLVRPRQPKRSAPTPSSSEGSDNNDSDNGAMQTMKENSYKALPLKRDRCFLKGSMISTRTKFSKVRKLATSSRMGAVTSTTAAGPKYFVDAVGSPDVPNSIKSVLKPHQISGVSFLWNCLTGQGKSSTTSPHVANEHLFKGAILADEMGLGKTLMTIAVLCALHRQKRDRRFVVVCPSSLVTNWANEFDKWLGKASQPKRMVVKKGGREAVSQIKTWSNKPSEVLIISYDLFRMNSDLFGKVNTPVACLVVDEGHRLKNTNGSLTLNALESLPCQSRLCITATPIQNILLDFFAIANFVCPGVLGDLATFRRDYERPIAASNNKTASSMQKQVGLVSSRKLEVVTKTFMLRRLQKDILKTILPPRNEVLVFCRPSTLQSNLYEQITRDHRNQDMKATSDALTSLMQLRKLCSHPALLQDVKEIGSSGNAIDGSGKLHVLSSLLQQIKANSPADKVVIVSNFTSALSMIEKSILRAHNYPFIRLDGATDVKKRQNVVDTFNTTTADRYFVFLLSSKAGGCGLNLIGANRLVMFDPDWNPASDIQAMARIYRQGQTKSCFIYRLFTVGTVEEVICQRQIQKGNLATRAVDGEVSQSKAGSTSFSKAELQDCFTLKRNVDCDTKTKLGKRWPDYNGTVSILDNGCTDEALIAVAEKTSNPVSFVHVVQEAVFKRGEGGALDSDLEDCHSNSENLDVDSSSEEELE